MLINAGAEARRGARTCAWLALEGGWLLAAGSWPTDKGSAAKEESRERGHGAELGSGLAQHRSHALGDTVTLGCRMGNASRLLKSILYPCTQTSAKGRAHSLEQVANFYQQWDSSSAGTSVPESPRRTFSGCHLPLLATGCTKAPQVGSSGTILEKCTPPLAQPHCKRGEHCFSSLQSCTSLLPLLRHPGTPRNLLSVRDQSSETPQWPLSHNKESLDVDPKNASLPLYQVRLPLGTQRGLLHNSLGM